MNRPYAAKLQELLEASYNLPNAVCDLGRVELGPVELEDITKRIYNHEESKIDAKAHYLLASSGFNAEMVLTEIAQLKFKLENQKFKSSAAKTSTNVKQLPSPQNATQQTKQIEDSISAQNTKDFDDFVESHVKVDYKTLKREAMNFLGRKPAKMRYDIGLTSNQNLILGTNLDSGKDFSTLMSGYAQKVTELVDQNLKSTDLVTKFSKVAAEFGSNQHICDAWRALNLQNPQKFLEKQFYEHINLEIASNRQNAKLGGEPSAFGKVKAYVRLKYYKQGQWDSRIGLVNQTPIWAYLYYLLRSGFVDEALKLVLERKDIFSSAGNSFATYFKAWAESSTHTLPKLQSEQLQNEFHQLFRPNRAEDPYKKALFKIIGRCELNNRSLELVTDTTEDWLWLQLMLCRDDDLYSLKDLKNYVLNIEQHFQSKPTQYFFILSLLGLWTEALRTLMKVKMEEHAVHFAIALAATKNSDFDSDLVPLVGPYTRKFRQAMPSLAVDYLCLISLSPKTLFVDKHLDKSKEKGTQSELAAREGLRELVLETRKFVDLLGDVDVNGQHTVGGCIEKRMHLVGLNDVAEYRFSIAHRAADTASTQGYTLDAILLYRLAHDYTQVFKLLNSRLGLLISGIQIGNKVEDSLDTSTEFLRLARNLMHIDTHQNIESLDKHRDTCSKLLAIVDCLDLAAANEYEACLSRIADTKLLVLSPTPAFEQVSKLSRDFNNYDESLACNIPTLLLVAMTSILKINEQLRLKREPANERVIEQNRGKASNCMVYAGLIQYRMPKEVYSKLTKLEDAT